MVSWLIFERKLDGDQVNVSNCSECYVSCKVFMEIFIGFCGIGVYINFWEILQTRLYRDKQLVRNPKKFLDLLERDMQLCKRILNKTSIYK